MRFTFCLIFVFGFLIQSSAQRIEPLTTVDAFGTALTLQPKTNLVWLAKSKPGKKANIDKKVKAHGKSSSKHFTHINISRIETDSPDLIESLREDVEYITPDSVVSIDAVPTDPMWSQQWDMQNIALPSAWDKTQGNADIVVAVFDTGIDYTHPDLAANMYSTGWKCLRGVMSEGGLDDNGHGTHVSGSIGAVANNGIGIAGVNWRIKLLPMKFLDRGGSGYISDVIALLDKTVELKQGGVNIRVGNNSWGGSGTEDVLRDAYQAVEDAGILSVCAAGNFSKDIDVDPFQPAGLGNRGILTVLASDPANKLADFSNYGFVSTDISAPGVNVLSTVPTNAYQIYDASGYKNLSGTSMSTPHVSGLAALVLAINENQTVYELKNTLLNYQSTDEMTEMGLLSSTGAKVNAQKTLANPLVLNPKTNAPPKILNVKHYDVTGGQTGLVSFAATDPQGEPMRFITVDRFNKTATLTNVVYPKTLNRYLDASFPYFVGASDRNGGSDGSNVFLNVYHDPKTFKAQDYKIGVSATNSGADLIARVWLITNSEPTREVYFKPYVTGKQINGLNSNWVPIGTGFTVNYRGFLDTNSSYMFKAYTENYQFAPHDDSDRIVIRLGTDVTNTVSFPKLKVTVNKLSGLNPLVVSFSMENLSNAKTNNTFYAIGQVGICQNCNQVSGSGSFFNGNITFAETGIKSLMFLVQDHENADNWDAKEFKVSVLAPTNSAAPIPPPIPILDPPTNLTVTKTGRNMLLNWIDNSSGEDRYEVEMTSKKSGPWPPFVKVATMPPNSQSYEYSFGVKNSNYQFRTRSAAGTNVSEYSNVANIRFK